MSSVPKNNWRVSHHNTLCLQAMSLIVNIIGTFCMGLLAVVLLTFAFTGAVPAQSPFLRTDRDTDPAYSGAYQHRLRELRERVAQNRKRWEEEQARASQQERARPQEDEDEHRSARALVLDDRRSPAGRTEQERASQQEREEDEHGFAAASGKCGDITTQKIGNFYYDSDGGVTQKVGNFLYGPDGEVTQKIGNFYYHSDGTTTQRIGNFYYDSDGGVTQKIGSFYYHSGGEPCEENEE